MGIHFHRIFKPTNLLAAVLLTALPAVSQAVVTTYNIQSGTAPSFSGSWIHSADTEGSTGYFTNGAKRSVTGSLTIDTGDLSQSFGQLLIDDGNFGLGAGSSWTIDLFNGASNMVSTFLGGEALLLSLDYTITGTDNTNAPVSNSGTFYFANRDFTGDTNITNGPNYFNDSILYLWGNNWINKLGAINKPERNTLGLDLYGVAVPEPTIALLLGLGLLGIASRKLIKSA